MCADGAAEANKRPVEGVVLSYASYMQPTHNGYQTNWSREAIESFVLGRLLSRLNWTSCRCEATVVFNNFSAFFLIISLCSCCCRLFLSTDWLRPGK